MTIKLTLAQRVGMNARALREAEGLTQRQVADIACMVHQEISRLESGRSNPRLDTLEQLARALGVSVEELVREDG